MPQTKTLRRAGSSRSKPAARKRSVSAAQVKLTDAEKAPLRDPSRVTEDDADAIVALRRLRAEKPIPLEKVLKRYGYRMEG